MSNEIELSIAKKPPGFRVNYLFEKKNKTNNNFFHKLFFGEKLSYKKIPIHKYELRNDTVFFIEYTNDLPLKNVLS